MTRRRPSGAPPPAVATIAGAETPLEPLADLVCERYRGEFPDEAERYGDAGVAWCRHDNQWLLSWAVDDVVGATDLCSQARWLASVLDARGFPVDRLARDLEIAADVVAGGSFGDQSSAVAARLARAAESVARMGSSSTGAGG